MRWILSAGIGWWGVSLLGASPQDQVITDELITRVYDQRGLQTVEPDFPGMVTWLPMGLAGFSFAGPESTNFGSECVALFGDLFWEQLEFEGRVIMEYGNQQVLLRAPRELHDAFVAFREQFASWQQQTVTLQVDVVTKLTGSCPNTPFLGAAAADAWIASAQGAVRTYVVQVPIQAFGTVRDQAVKRLLASASVEIAQGTATIEERGHSYRYGSFGVFMAAPHADGVDVNMSWMTSQEPTFQLQSLGTQVLLGGEGQQPGLMPLGGQLQLSAQQAKAITARAFVPDGKVWVTCFGNYQEAGSSVLMVRCLTRDLPQSRFVWNTKKVQRIQWFSEGPHANKQLSLFCSDPTFEANGYAGYPLTEEQATIDFSSSGTDALHALLDDANTELVELWEPAGGIALRTNGSEGTSMESREAELDRLTRRVETLAVALPNYSVRVTLEKGNAAALSLLDGVTQEGTVLALLVGNERAEIREYQSEVAGQAAIQCPEVRLTCEGLVGQLRIHRLGANRIRLETHGQFLVPLDTTVLDFESRMHASYRSTTYANTSLEGVHFLTEEQPGVWKARMGAKGAEGTALTIEVRAL